MPVSSTAITTPLPPPPRAPSAARLAHAWGASTPNAPVKFHCSCCQPPGVCVVPGSLGMKLGVGGATLVASEVCAV